MKSKAELEQDIINITMKIYHEFPELSKYIAEMPLKLSGISSGGMSTKNLKEYSNSLEELLVSYLRTRTHTVKGVEIGTDTLNLL